MRRIPGIFLTATLLASGQTFDNTVAPFINRNCIGCHNAKLSSGELDLQKHSAAGKALEDRTVWETVVQKLRTGEMPPKGMPRPKQADIDRVTKFIEAEYDRRDRNAKPDPGRVTARRLNRYEYNNTIRDLTGVTFRPADDFPADDSGYGFDNIGDVLSLSPVLMEKYLAAAEAISRAAVVTGTPQFRNTRTLLKAENFATGEYIKAAKLAPGAEGPVPSKQALHVRHKFPVEGDYDIRIGLGGVRPNEPERVEMTLWIDGEPVKTYSVNPKQGQPRNFEIRQHLTAGEHAISAAFVNDHFEPEKNPIAARDRYLALDLFEVRGPSNPVAPPIPESHRKLIFCHHEPNQHGPDCARTLVSAFARRAYRRDLRPGEIDPVLKLMKSAQDDGETFESAFRLAMETVLVSPHFLFRIERDPNPRDADARHQISEFELATRLSYFLWSSTPDDHLLDLASRGELRRNLKAETKRMIEDPKSAALAENFAGQWLQLRNLAEAKPDPDKFPNFDETLRDAMKRETELFFEAVLKEDRSVLDFLDGKFTYLNERLALHYGIPAVEGSEFRRVELTNGQRSGILTQASVLTVSSYPTRTSPVIRGKWVLENLLNAPPPPPPANVPNLDEAAVGNTGSLRQQLEKHRANSVCASCHSRMDPLGFGLENYDAIGAWRTKDGKFPIDVSGTLPNGKSFRSASELKTILKADKDAFARCMTEKLLTYAIGRGLDRTDRSAVQSVSSQSAANGYRFSSFIQNVVESMPFQMRRGESVQRTASAQ